MPDYKKYIIVKTVDLPQEQKFQDLSKIDEYEHLNTLDPLGVPMGTVEMTEEEVERVRELPQVKEVYEEKIYSVPEPKDETGQGIEDMQLHNFTVAHEKGYKGQGKKVAVLDTGLDDTHSSRLGSRLLERADFTFSASGPNDRQGHGTHCMGLIANGAPEAILLSGKVLGDNGSGSTSGIIKGINWAISKGANVISQSLGSFPDSDPMNDALSIAVNAARDKGVLMPVAAGNDQNDVSDPNRNCADETVPAAASRAITVAAVDHNNNIGSFSNKGTCIDIAAFGVNVVSWGLSGTYGRLMTGTSMATPLVAAAVTVLLGASSVPDMVEKALYEGANDTALDLLREGHGVMDVAASLALLLGETVGDLPRISLYKLDEERGDLLLQDWQLTVGSGTSRKDIGIYRGKQ